MRKLTAIILAIFMAAMTVGCVKNQPKPEPPVVQYQRTVLAAADATNVVASGLQAVNEARKTLVATGQMDPSQSAALKAALDRVAQKNEAAIVALTVANDGSTGVLQNGWRKAILDVAIEFRSIDPKLFGVKNPNSQATLNAALATLQASIQLIEMSFPPQAPPVVVVPTAPVK